MNFAVGALVKAREREWVVQPQSTNQLLILRPLGGSDREITGILPDLEEIRPAAFSPPDPQKLGDHASCRLLRDTARLGIRNSAGPFRSFGHLAVEPRPYQLVPLLMALKMEPVRILIADDVGIGKTIEAGLIAREMLDRGEVAGMAVLCSPQLAKQWQRELREKFNLDPALVLASTASRLEKNCRTGQSLFELYRHVVVSTDFIKSDRRRNEFLVQCPDLVIVDEAHTCVGSLTGKSGRHQRYQLLHALSQKKTRHLILATASPHSGKEDAFRTLLSLLKPEFAQLPESLGGEENTVHRRHLAQYFVQRTRGDIRHYMQTDTPFPQRISREAQYLLSTEYRGILKKVTQYAREMVREEGGSHYHRRVRWWSALSLLRALSSSPPAAEATMRNRATLPQEELAGELEEMAAKMIMDTDNLEDAEVADLTPGSDISELEIRKDARHNWFLEMARQVSPFQGEKDTKLQVAIQEIRQLIQEGYSPIVFCRFIDTAEYVGQQLRCHLPEKVDIITITGNLPPSERENRIRELEEQAQRVLVCTDCLSEGVNLQQHFNAVLHYDLSWNPNRHEQRAGRIDRFGQPRDAVKVITLYGGDNPIDGIILDVLLRKHDAIRDDLGVSIPMPQDAEKIMEAVFEGLLMREDMGTASSGILQGFEAYMQPKKDALHKEWESIHHREKRSRTMFAQETIHVSEVERELASSRAAIGQGTDVEHFFTEVLSRYQGRITGNAVKTADLSECPEEVRDCFPETGRFEYSFQQPLPTGVNYLHRTHQVVEKLSDLVFQSALDPQADSVARRCGVIRTREVNQRTILLLLRFRYQLLRKHAGTDTPMLAEECRLAGFSSSPENAAWLQDDAIQTLLQATPDENILPDMARESIRRVLEQYPSLEPHLTDMANSGAQAVLDAHNRLRRAARITGSRLTVEPKLPPDLLGLYIYLPTVRS